MKIKKILLLCATTMLFVACGKDDHSPVPIKPVLPSSGEKPITSITRLGNVESGYDWNFTYSDGRLTNAIGTLRDPSASVDRSFTYTSTFAYGAKEVSLNSSTGEKITLQLNGEGYVSKMLVNRNIYTFQYNYSGQLCAWSKQVFEESLGQIQQYNSSATIDYDAQGALQKIVYKGVDNRQTILTFTNYASANRNGLMPPTIARELGCIGFEQLYYAGLLGRPTRLLVKSIKYDFYDDSNAIASTQTTDFEYGYQSDGNIELCNYHIAPSGNIASVSYKYN